MSDMLSSAKIVKAVTEAAYIAAAAAFILLSANATGSEIENRLASIKK
jgi:hypothetical protein